MNRVLLTAVGLIAVLAVSVASAPADTGVGATTAAAKAKKKCKKKAKASVRAKAKAKKKCRKAKRPAKPATPAPAIPTSRVRAELTVSNDAGIFMQVRDVAGNYGLRPDENDIANSTYTEAPGKRTFTDNAFLAPARPFSVAICAALEPPVGTTATFAYTDRNGNTTTTNIAFEGGVDSYFFTEPGSFNPGGTPCT
jgi:hypothetical protein